MASGEPVRPTGLQVNWYHNVTAAGNTWFNEATAGISRSDVTRIQFAPVEPAFFTKTWIADEGGTGAVACYLSGTTVTVVGDGENGIYAHNGSASTFFSGFTKATTITGLNLLHLDNVANEAVVLPSIDIGDFYEFLGWSATSLDWTTDRSLSDAAISAQDNTYTGEQINLYAVMKLIDNEPPTCTVSKSPIGYTSGDVTVTVSASDAGSGFARMRFNGSAWSTEAENTYTVSNNGTYTLEAVDVAGNTASYDVLITTIDREQPATPSVSCMQGTSRIIGHNGWGNGTLTVTFSGSATNPSGIANYMYSIDGGTSWTVSSGSVQLDVARTYTIVAKAVSATGIVSNVSDPFVVGIDRTPPTLTISGVPDTWTDHADLRVAPSDSGGSGVAAVYYYDEGGNRIRLDPPYQLRVEQNDSYTFEVEDGAGNTGVDVADVTYIDNKPPVIVAGTPREVELAADRSYALIHLAGYDVGAAGFASFTYPNGGTTSESEISYKVMLNGPYEFTATDSAGNSSTHTTKVTGITLSEDTSIDVTVFYADKTASKELSHGATETISADTGGVTDADLLISCKGTGAIIESVNGVAVDNDSYNLVFSLGPNQTSTYVIDVSAANEATDSYTLIISTQNEPPTLVEIGNRTTVEKTRYTESGTVTARQYAAYTPGKEGVEIQITACDPNIGQYISGYVAYEGINYPIEWGRLGSGATEYETHGSAKKGFALIPTSAFYTGTSSEDRNGTYAYVYLFDSLTPGGDPISGSITANNSVRIQTDVEAPEVVCRMSTARYALYVTVTDSVSIANIQITLTPTSGPNIGVASVYNYTQKQLNSPIALENATSYTVRIVAEDVAGHITDVTKSISYLTGINEPGADPGSGDSGGVGLMELPVDFSNTKGKVYTYKTRKGSYYIIGSGSGDVDTIRNPSSFYYYNRDAS